MPTPPSLSPEQREAALEKAAAARRVARHSVPGLGGWSYGPLPPGAAELPRARAGVRGDVLVA